MKKRPMAQSFLKIVRGKDADIEQKCDEEFLALFQDGMKIARTQFFFDKDTKDVHCYITYFNPS